MHKISITAKGIRIIAALAVAAGASVSLGPADAAFTTPWVVNSAWNLPDITSGNDYTAPVLADFNNDGKLDAAVGTVDGYVYFYFNQGTNTNPVWPSCPPPTTSQPTCPSMTLNIGTGNGGYDVPAVADLNNDGRPDLLVGNRGTLGPPVLAYENTGTGSPGDPPVWTRMTSWDPPASVLSGLLAGSFYSPALADLNHDGTPDLLVGGFNGYIRAFQNTGTGNPGDPPVWQRNTAWDLPDLVGNKSAPALADLDGDGDYDLMIGGQQGTIFALRNIGSVTSPDWQSMGSWFVADPSSTSDNFAHPALGDLNDDGNIDLLYGTQSGIAVAYKDTGLPLTEPGTSPPPPPSGTSTVSETFDNFMCTGAWKADSGGPNSSYTRDCGNGWTAYALDSSNTAVTPPWNPGPVGNQNVVTLDAINGPSAANPGNPPLGSAQIYTNPTNSVEGELWLMKTFPVIPGEPISTLTGDFRIKVTGTSDEYAGIMVFNGTLTRPPSNQAYAQGVPPNALASALVHEGGSCADWCPWHSVSIGGATVLPSLSTITVVLKVSDIRSGQNSFADFDNLTVSGVVSPAQSSVPVGDIASLWKSVYTAPATAAGSNNMAEPAAVAVDATDNVYVAGSTYNGVNYDILTIKYDPSGNVLWTAKYDGGDADQATGISVDGSGNVYVTGRSFQSGTNSFVALKYNSSGAQQWGGPVIFDDGRDDQPAAQVLDASGNLYVTGSSCDAASPSTGCDYVTVKYDSSGTSQWPGGRFYDGGGIDHAAGLGVDGSGNVYVTGTSANPLSPGVDNIATVKYNSTGVEQWTGGAVRTNSGSDDHAVAIAVDNAGDSYVTGWNFRGSGTGTPSILTIKYDTAGVRQWQQSYDDGKTDQPVAITLDASGSNAYVTGVTGDVTNHDIVTIQYPTDGSGGWVRTYGNSNLDDRAASVAVDGGGNVYVFGSLTRSAGNTDFVTLRYDPSGTATNAITYDGYGLTDTPVAMALGVDTQGDTVPVVVGSSAGGGGLDHISTVRYEKALPDLTIDQVSGPTSVTVGNSMDVSNTVRNIDDVAAKKHADSGPFGVALYLAPAVGGAPDFNNMILLTTRSVSNLSPGQTSTDSTSVNITSSVPEGTYYVVAVADPGNAVTEEDETNNRLAASSTIFVQGVKPDLAITSISAPATVTPVGSSFEVDTTVTNIVSTGTGTTDFVVGVYACPDTNITTSCTQLDSYTVTGGLVGFASDTHKSTVSIGSGGSYYIGAIADVTNTVDEANETNNTAVNTGGSSLSTQLVTDQDFYPGIYVTGTASAAVEGAGHGARVTLFKSVSWQPISAWNAPDIGSYAKPALGDLNDDGKPDLLIGDSTGIVHAYENIGDGTNPIWSAAPLAWNISSACTTYGGGGFATPALADLDGDGDLDMMLGNRDGVCAYKNTGTVTAPQWQREPAWDLTGLPSNDFYDPALGDLNDDGKPDMMLGSTTGIVAYRNNGMTASPPWTAVPAWDRITASDRWSPAMADLNGDGRDDMMIGLLAGNVGASINNGSLTVPSWAGQPSWSISDPDTSTNNLAGPAMADLDGDGDFDLLYGDVSGVSFGYRNIGTFSASGTYYSKVVDAGNHGGFTTLSYTSTVPTGATLTVDVRAGDSTDTTDGSWTSWHTGVADGGSITFLNPPSGIHEYVQYRLNFGTSDNTKSAALFSIQAGTQPPAAQQTVVSVVSGGGSGGGGLSVLDLLAMAAMACLGRLARGRRPRQR